MRRHALHSPADRVGEQRRAGRTHHRRIPPRVVVVLGLGSLVFASCEREPTKSDYIDARVKVECAGQTGEAFRSCRLEVIKKYMRVPLEELQSQFPPPAVGGRTGCA